MVSKQYGLNEIKKVVAAELVPLVAPGVIFALNGSLGVGKTTVVRELLSQLGLDIPVVSPTFAYFNEYKLPSGYSILHFDLYRIGSEEEFNCLGFGELIGDFGNCSLIEWPELIATELNGLTRSHNVYQVELKYIKKDLSFRQISVVPYK